MADAIREHCLKSLKTTLETITTGNGYPETVRSVQRLKQLGQEIVELPAIIIKEMDEDIMHGPLAGGSSLITRLLQVGLVLLMNQVTETDARSADEVMTTLRASVQRALALNTQLDGHAIDVTELSNTATELEEGMPQLESAMIYQIHYRHRLTDPTLAE